jgi:16S rRNA (cytosine1402-N4)-methyltransferase
MAKHIPVLLNETIRLLNPQPGEKLIDCTFGAGGHSRIIAKKIGSQGKILAIEANPQTVDEAKRRTDDYQPEIILVNDNFVNLKKIYEQYFPYSVNLVLFDLGLSSMELDETGRGFSFRFDEPLDMRFNPFKQRLTAKEVVNKYGEHKLTEIFINYGQVSKQKAVWVAKEIVKRRGRGWIMSTNELVKVIFTALHPKLIERGAVDLSDVNLFKGRGGRKRRHPATKFFQAIRIEVNNELVNLEKALSQAVEILAPAGRLAVISFHSLEDRIVKRKFKSLAAAGEAEQLTLKPITPTDEEVFNNPRSRSAKLRVIRKIK